MHLPSVCLIVPVYNEYRRLDARAYQDFLANYEKAHLIFVNDGSTDRTADLLLTIQGFDPSRVEIVGHGMRRGKAEAIRSGMLRALDSGSYHYLGFIDADLAVPISDIVFFIKQLAGKENKMAFGIRSDINKTNITRTAVRKAMGNAFRVYLHQVLKFHIADSQCGAKVFAAEIVPVLYREPFETHWLMDIELMIRYCDHFGISRGDIHEHLLQIPVSRFQDRAHSKFTARELIRTLRELVIITFRPDLR